MATSDAGKTETKQEDGAKASTGVARWVRMSALLLTAVFLGFGVWLLIDSQAIVGSANDRNFHNLEVAAHGLEAWPRDVQTLAANNYSKERLVKPTGDVPAKAFAMARFNHPQLGRFRIYYLPADQCGPAAGGEVPTEADAGDTPPTEAASRDDQPVFTLGRFPGQGPVFRIRRPFVAVERNAGVPAQTDPLFGTPDAGGRLCFQVSIPLDKLIALERAAPHFSHLLILAADGTVVQQLGRTSLPVGKLEKFAPGDTLTRGLVQQLTTGKAQDKPAETSADIPLDAVQKAVEITIADTPYIAYVRPFAITDQAPACRVTTKRQGTDFGDGSKCYAVALMPSASLRHAWLSPSTAMVASFGLVLLMILALLPLIRLLLIGGAETAGSLEMAGIVLGLQTAAAVATLAVLFAMNLVAERGVAQDEAQALARDLATSAGREIAGAAHVMLQVARSPRNAWTDYCAATGDDCKSARAGPQGVVTWQPREGAKAPYLPPLWSITYVNATDWDRRGRPVDGTFTLAGTQEMTPRIDVRWRDYFIAYLDGRTRPVPGDQAMTAGAHPGYTVGQVRSQTDGVNKTILTVGPVDPPERLRFPDFRGATAKGGALVAPIVLRSFLAPVLPAPHHFLVVDTSQDSLPVLFHSEPDRACIDQLGDQIHIDGEVRQVLRFPRSEGGMAPISFTARYDGVPTRFTAARVPGTDWAVMTFYTLDDVDRIVGKRVVMTLAGWGSLAMIGMVLFAGWLWLGRETWRQLWPHQQACMAYWRRALILAAAAVLTVIVITLAASPLVGVFAGILLWGGAVTLAGSLAFIHPEPKPIRPETEWGFRALVLALLICCAAVPMVALWRDAGVLTHALAERERAAQARTDAADRQGQALAIQRSYREDSRPMPLLATQPGFPGLVPGTVSLEPLSSSFIASLWRLETGLPLGVLPRCAETARADIWGCWLRRSGTGREVETVFGLPSHGAALARYSIPSGGPFLLFLFAMTALIVGCAVILSVAVHLCLRAAAGFGVPLGAVNWPSLALSPDELGAQPGHGAVQLLGRKSLLVAPQQAIRERLLRDIPLIDFGEPGWASAKARAARIRFGKHNPDKDEVTRIAFTGLEMVLRDVERRQLALQMLEEADRDVEAAPGRQLIIIAEMAPLERILDAFEIEYVVDDGKDKMREELRWARLFHDFSTFSFAPIDKIDNAVLEEKLKELRGPGPADRARIFLDALLGRHREADPTTGAVLRAGSEIEAIRTLVQEVRWLPGNVIDGIINDGLSRARFDAEPGPYPLPSHLYRDYYTPRIIAWAASIRPPSRAAALDFMRSNIIEHYEQCWASSTYAERFVLDALAQGRFVNMTRAIALQSLVRRGLVVLDPAPRLMNESFALFVRQAERPNRLQQWKEKQPRSPWSNARLPILIAVPLVVLAVAAAAAESGQSLPALASLLAAGAPALLAALINGFARKS